MTCYLKLRDGLVGVPRADEPIDWDNVVESWQAATSVADRDSILATMHLELIDTYALPEADLSRFSGFIVEGGVDQEFLYRHREVIRSYLDSGGVIVYSGELFRAWLPKSQLFVKCADGSHPETAPTFASHPVFDGLEPGQMGAHFVSGHHPVPPGAEIVVSLSGGEAAVYVDTANTAGTVMVHAGHTLLGYAANPKAEAAARRLLPQFLSWIRAEGAPC